MGRFFIYKFVSNLIDMTAYFTSNSIKNLKALSKSAILAIIAIFSLSSFFIININISQAAPPQAVKLAKHLAGKILLQVEERGRLWYVNPDDSRKYLVTRRNILNVYKKLALGITNKDLASIPSSIDNFEVGIDSDGDGYSDRLEVENGYSPFNPAPVKMKINKRLAKRLAGKLLLQVEDRGRVWYVHPDTLGKYELPPSRAIPKLGKLALGITDNNISKITNSDDLRSNKQTAADTSPGQKESVKPQDNNQSNNIIVETPNSQQLPSTDSQSEQTQDTQDTKEAESQTNEQSNQTTNQTTSSGQTESTDQTTIDQAETQTTESSETAPEATTTEVVIQPIVSAPVQLPTTPLPDQTDNWEEPTGEDVLVVYNLNYITDDNNNGIADGQEIAEYYKAARNIPATNLCSILAAPQEEITLEEFDEELDANGDFTNHIRQQIETCLDYNGLKYLVDYIVLTKGVPLKINSSGVQLSVDQAVTQLYKNNSYSKITSQYPTNPIDPRYKFFKSHQPNSTLTYLVSRLDGYAVVDITSAIDRAINTPQTDQYAWVLDDHASAQATSFDNMQAAYDSLKIMGQTVYPATWSATSTELNKWVTTSTDPIMGYVSHGIHAGMPDGYISNTLNFDYANGAIFTTYESFNGYGFTSPDQSNHGQVAEFIAAGGSGGVGNVYEPMARGIVNEYYLFRRYLYGNTFAEAVYSSLKYSNWMSVVVGDPLMRINPYPLPQPLPDSHVLLKAKIFLEGAFNKSSSTLTTILQDRDFIPLTAPYSEDPHIINSIPENITDWVLVELRPVNLFELPGDVFKSIFVRQDGQLIDDDGSETIIINGLNSGNYYLVIRHRNHLAVMSSKPLSLNSDSTTFYDFTTDISKYYGSSAAKEISDGIWAMWAADMNHDEVINTTDWTRWWDDVRAGASGYLLTDANLDGYVTTKDFTKYANNVRAVSKSAVPGILRY